MLRIRHSISQICSSCSRSKGILGNLPIPAAQNSPDCNFLSVQPPSPTGKNLHQMHSLQVKTRPTCLGRFWNQTTERPERQLHSSAAMLRFDYLYFRRPNHRKIISVCIVVVCFGTTVAKKTEATIGQLMSQTI